MALPEPFSDIEHLQLVIRRELNRDIREHFRDLHNEAGDWEPEVQSTRGSMLRALLHEDSDPIAVTSARMMLYYFTYGKQQEIPIFFDETKRPTDDFTYRPEIKLFFSQSRRNIPQGQAPAQGYISYRLINETSESLTEANVALRANKIKSLFTQPNLYVWDKGKEFFTYLDKKNGYSFQLLVTTESEAKRIIEQVLDIESKTPEFERLVHHNNSKTYSNLVQTKRIYGKNRKVPRRRPTEKVKFRYASIKIDGIPRPIYIVDCRYGEAIVKTF